MTAGGPCRRIGFTGKRNGALRRGGGRAGALRDSLGGLFSRLCAPDERAVLVTGLAFGADQTALVAVADLRAERRAWRVEAVLPARKATFIALARDDYELDHGPIATVADAERFVLHWRAVLGRVDHVIEMEALRECGECAARPLDRRFLDVVEAEFGPLDPHVIQSRRLGYGPAGEVILDRSDGLVAVWDGSTSRGAGGTADMIERARGRNMPVLVLEPAGPAASPSLPGFLDALAARDLR